MKLLASVGVVLAVVASTAGATVRDRAIAAAGVRLVLPARWHGSSARDAACDPRRLLVASSAPIRLRPGGAPAAPGGRQVLVVVLEDRYAQDRPLGDLRRPKQFSVAWDRLRRLDGGSACGLPAAPAYLRYFEAHGRYIGFAVFPGSRPAAATRAQTLALLDSVRVSARPSG